LAKTTDSSIPDEIGESETRNRHQAELVDRVAKDLKHQGQVLEPDSSTMAWGSSQPAQGQHHKFDTTLEEEVFEFEFQDKVVSYGVQGRQKDTISIHMPNAHGEPELVAEIKGPVYSGTWAQPTLALEVWVKGGDFPGGNRDPRFGRRSEQIELLKTYTLIQYTTPGVIHVYMMRNRDSACIWKFSRALLLPSSMWVFEPRVESHSSESWWFEKRQRPMIEEEDMSQMDRRLSEIQVSISIIMASVHSRHIEKLWNQGWADDQSLLAKAYRFVVGG